MCIHHPSAISISFYCTGNFLQSRSHNVCEYVCACMCRRDLSKSMWPLPGKLYYLYDEIGTLKVKVKVGWLVLHSAAFTPRESPWYSFYRRLSGPQDQSGDEGVKKSLHLFDIRDRIHAVLPIIRLVVWATWPTILILILIIIIIIITTE